MYACVCGGDGCSMGWRHARTLLVVAWHEHDTYSEGRLGGKRVGSRELLVVVLAVTAHHIEARRHGGLAGWLSSAPVAGAVVVGVGKGRFCEETAGAEEANRLQTQWQGCAPAARPSSLIRTCACPPRPTRPQERAWGCSGRDLCARRMRDVSFVPRVVVCRGGRPLATSTLIQGPPLFVLPKPSHPCFISPHEPGSDLLASPSAALVPRQASLNRCVCVCQGGLPWCPPSSYLYTRPITQQPST